MGTIHYKWSFSLAMLVYQRVLYFFHGITLSSSMVGRAFRALLKVLGSAEKCFQLDGESIPSLIFDVFCFFIQLHSIWFDVLLRRSVSQRYCSNFCSLEAEITEVRASLVYRKGFKAEARFWSVCIGVSRFCPAKVFGCDRKLCFFVIGRWTLRHEQKSTGDLIN